MKAFTISDRVVQGVGFIQDAQGDYVVRCGNEGIPLVGGLVDLLRQQEQDLEARAGGVIGYLASIDKRSPTGHIISEGWVSPAGATRILVHVSSVGWPIHNLVGARDGLRAPSRPDTSGRAMVHVIPQALDPKSIRFWRNDPREQEVRDDRNGGDKVTKIYEPFPGVGCTVHLHGYDEHGAPQMLVEMVRGSSFRISRQTAEDEPAEFVVVWTGSVVKLIPSKRHAAA